MIYYKSKTGEVFAVNPIQTPKKEWAVMTKKETEAHLNPVPTSEQLADIARAKRDDALIALDRAISNPLRYAELSDEQRSEAASYRRLLLDVPQQGDFPISYIMPTVPTWLSME